MQGRCRGDAGEMQSSLAAPVRQKEKWPPHARAEGVEALGGRRQPRWQPVDEPMAVLRGDQYHASGEAGASAAAQRGAQRRGEGKVSEV